MEAVLARLVAVGLDGRGDVTETRVRWRFSKSLPDLASPLIYEDVLYLVKGGGVMTALDPQNRPDYQARPALWGRRGHFLFSGGR